MKNALIPFLIICIGLSPIKAQVFVNANATGTNDGTSWTNAYTDLVNAIVSSPTGSQIWIASATYVPGGDPNASFLIDKQLELYGGFTGTESSLAERDIAANPTILSGDNNGDDTPGDFLNQRLDNANTVLRFTSTIDNSTIIDGFTIRGGQADSISTDLLYNSGAGIYTEGKPIIRHCTITDNFASNLGGGLLAEGMSAGGILIESCSFTNNYSDNVGGGAMISGTGLTVSHIIDCEFENNFAVQIGGGIMVGGSSSEIRSSLFKDNTANFLGGGVMLFSGIDNRHNVIDSCVFENNLSTLGGGIYAEPQGSMISLLVQNSRFSGNRAELLTPSYSPSGGGIEVFYDPIADRDTSIIRACTFENNEAEYSGGGLYFVGLGSNTLSLVDSCIFQSNFLTTDAFQGAGSAYFNLGNSNDIQYRRSQFSDNRNGNRGALSLVYGANSEGESLVQECDFIDNIANSYGSGISVRAFSSALSADIRIEDSYFEGNLISNPLFGQGGALTIASFLNDFEAVVNRCEFVDNRNSNSAAAIQLLEDPPSPSIPGATATIQNSLFTRHDTGRAVIIADKFPNTILSNNTIADNDIDAIIVQNGANIKLRNNILSGTELAGPNLQASSNSSIESLGGNLSSDSSGVGLLGAQDIIGIDPEFEYGADAPYKISFLSPGVDLGVFYQGFLPSETDALGNPRFQGSAIDAGAYESPFVTSVAPSANAYSLHFYPVPVVEQATIELDNAWQGEIVVSVYNQLGQKMYQEQISKRNVQQSWQIDISHLPAGNYQLVLAHETTTVSKGFVKR